MIEITSLMSFFHVLSHQEGRIIQGLLLHKGRTDITYEQFSSFPSSDHGLNLKKNM